MAKKPLVSKVHDQLDKLEMDTRKAIKEQPDKGKFLVDEFTKRTNDIGIDGLTDDQKKEFKQAVDKKVKDLKALAKSLKENRGNKVMEKKTVMEAVDEVGKDKNVTGQDVPMGLGKAGEMCDCVHAEVDVAFADAVNQDKENREHMNKMWKDMENDAKDITPKDPERPMKEKNMFTEKLTLDESLFEDIAETSNKSFANNIRTKLSESSKRDDIDAKRDNRVERAKARFNKVRDDADAQRDDRLRKRGLKESDKPAALSIKDAQKWVDYDMKRYGKISDRTNRLVKKAGFQILKDDHGDYEVAAGKFESVDKGLQEKNEYPGWRHMSGSERHNARMSRIFDRFEQRIDDQVKFLIAHGVSEEEAKKLKADTGLGKNAVSDKLIELGLEDEYWKTVTESLKKELEEAVAESCKSKESCSKELTEAPIYDLAPQYDARQSFYNKAKVDTGDNNDKNKLYSYNTLVAEIKDGKPVVYGTFSATTLRHIKEWLKQNGFKAENSRQIMADYGVKEECAK